MNPVFNLEPKYRLTMLAIEEWTRGPGTPAVKGLIWFIDGSRTLEGPRAGVYGQSADRRLSISLAKHATVFQAEVCAILACVHKTETQDLPEKYVSICSDSQEALKAFSGCQNNVCLGTTMPEGIEKYLYLAHWGGMLRPWACRSARK